MPPGALQVIPDPTLDVSQYLFHHPGVDLIWTTGGPKAVAAANAAGKPCISVGAGNAPVYVHRSADVPMAVIDILISKTFDASVICPAEQMCVVDEPIYDAMVDELRRMGARVLTPEETGALVRGTVDEDGRMSLSALGQACTSLGAMSGVEVGAADKVLVAPLPSDLDELAGHPFIQEKLMPVLGLVRSPSVEHGIAACELVTEHGGLGHTSAVYATDESVIDRFAATIRTGRILVNAPTAVGALGGVYNSMTPTFSLGCGTWGGSLTTDNVNYRNLLNVKTVSRRQTPPQWFRVPSDTYFNAGAIENLRELDLSSVVVVTDAGSEARGVVESLRPHLGSAAVHVFADVEPEPGEEIVRAGVKVIDELRPDAIVAIGGGSVIDAAKAMRLFHESPELTLRELSLPFLDARKRVARYPNIAHSVKLVALPTTAGTGSEVSPAAVLTAGGRKVTLVDYSLVPDVAIVDPTLTLSLPPGATADTGIDALTHAVEAFVSIFASPYTDAFCLQAINLIFNALPRAYADGSDLQARTDMANASTIAGLAFSNAFVGVNHALAHAVGARFGIPHGRANAIFLPHVLRYNAELPSKFMPAPGYHTYVAPERFAQIAWVIGLGGKTEEEAAKNSDGTTKLELMDLWTTELNELGTLSGRSPATANCSAHWFDEDAGLIAQGWYDQGVRFLDISNPSEIRQVGYWATAGTFWAAYFAPSDPEREVVYGLDTAGGIDVLHIDRSGSQPTVRAPTTELVRSTEANTRRYTASSKFGMVCAIAGSELVSSARAATAD